MVATAGYLHDHPPAEIVADQGRGQSLVGGPVA